MSFQWVFNCPLLRQIKKLPVSAALGAAVIVSVQLLPALVLRGVPDDLRIRPPQDIRTPALQLLPITRIQYFIVSPSICNLHMCVSFLDCNLFLLYYIRKLYMRQT